MWVYELTGLLYYCEFWKDMTQYLLTSMMGKPTTGCKDACETLVELQPMWCYGPMMGSYQRTGMYLHFTILSVWVDLEER